MTPQEQKAKDMWAQAYRMGLGDEYDYALLNLDR